MSDLIGLRQFVTGSGIFAFMDAPWTPIYITVMFIFHPLFGISAIICAIIMIIIAVTMEKLTAKRLLESNSLATKASISFQNNLRNAEVIHGMGMEAKIRQKDAELYLAAGNEQAIGSTTAGRLTAVSKSFRLIAQSTVLGIGAYLAVNQQISPGMMIAGSLLLGRALAPIDMMVGSWKGFVDAKSQFRRLRNILANFPRETDRMDLPNPIGNLSVEQVIIVPPGSQAASVKGVGFQLAAGEALGIIGPSAAGKTSLARGILGVWPARAGTVRLDNAELGHWDRERLGPHLGYLPQDIELFDGSIAENICRFSELNSELIIEAAKIAGIHDMILRLPEGYDTIITSVTGALSAGQRQRVALARAIYNFPKLIILDEPNSNLDDQGERDLLSALRKMKEAGSTVIVITHRTSILSLVDKLLLMRDGVVASFGQRDEVLEAIKESNKKVATLQQKV
jgi:ATP-binding cassette subfamily C protein EexD